MEQYEKKFEKKIVAVQLGFSNYKSMANFDVFSWNISKKFEGKKNDSDLFGVMSLHYSFPDRSQICYCAIFPKIFLRRMNNYYHTAMQTNIVLL